MDFYQITEREGAKKGTLEVFPDFKTPRSKDLMIRGKQFYAIWDEEKGLWSTDEYDVQRLIDKDLLAYEVKTPGVFEIKKRLLGSFSTNSWLQFRNYVGHLSDNFHALDSKLTFKNTVVKKEDYVSRRLPYDLSPGDISAWNEIVDTLYSKEEREKIEWAIGAIISGDSTHIQKALVFYGAGGTGKGTILNIVEQLFEGYTATFVAKDVTGSSNGFALEAFKTNPLVAIDHDGDLSKIQDNTKLNSIISHDWMFMNEKGKPQYRVRFNAFVFVGSNSPVKFTDARSGLIRRIIDVQPTGNLIGPRKYQTLINQIPFELGAIAHHCLEEYRARGKDYYASYQPVEMMLSTDVFFNFIEAHYDIFTEQDGVSLTQAYDLYKQFCDESGVEYRLPKYKMRDELKNYFEKFTERAEVDGVRVRSWFSVFNAERFKQKNPEEKAFSLVMEHKESLLDKMLAEYPAQYEKADGTPQKYWTNQPKINRDGQEFIPSDNQVCSTKLKDIDTSKIHFVKPPENHIVIDFDLTDAEGNKSAERNLEAASTWPPTYAEFSKSGAGVHLHYIYEGDPTELSRLYDEGIEIKVFTGASSLRRMLSACNDVPVATISGGLPLKEKKVINEDQVKSEKALRDLIMRNLRKEIHSGTKSSMDFIHKILEDAYKSDLSYDVTDMRNKILTFAMRSTNQKDTCIKLMQTMKFKSEETLEAAQVTTKDDTNVFFDVEVFPNLFIVCWKYENDKDAFGRHKVTRMINPSPQAIENLMSMKLIGFNCRRYDNHILYGRRMGYDNEQLYKLSQKIINNVPGALFGNAYNVSYTDIYDFSSKKQSLKKFQIELGLKHQELGLPWDEPVPKALWDKVAEYCDNDVISTEETFHARKEDFIARQILADLSGLSLNASTQQHTAKIVFGEDRKPQEQFHYTDLSEMFPGYEFGVKKKEIASGRTVNVFESTYRGEITGEGGYVYAEPGMYYDVALLDVASMHPTSIEELELFGSHYTKNFTALLKVRLAIKRGDYEEAKQMFGGKLAKYLGDPSTAEALSYALKIVINIVYGLTSAKFENAFRDPRNIDNIVAKRGALFMIELKHFVQNYRGRYGERFTVAHIKTDSIKIPNATKEIIEAVMEFGKKYGYDFEHEETYEKFCLVNESTYIAYTKQGKKPPHWVATGAQFQHPYVFKTLFSHEPIKFRDKCEERHVTSALYLDFEGIDPHESMALSENQKHFVGKAGLFCPIIEGRGGGYLVREKDGKFHAAAGSKGYFWLESETVVDLHMEKDIDLSYFRKLVDEAIDTISKFGDFEAFVSDTKPEEMKLAA